MRVCPQCGIPLRDREQHERKCPFCAAPLALSPMAVTNTSVRGNDPAAEPAIAPMTRGEWQPVRIGLLLELSGLVLAFLVAVSGVLIVTLRLEVNILAAIALGSVVGIALLIRITAIVLFVAVPGRSACRHWAVIAVLCLCVWITAAVTAGVVQKSNPSVALAMSAVSLLSAVASTVFVNVFLWSVASLFNLQRLARSILLFTILWLPIGVLYVPAATRVLEEVVSSNRTLDMSQLIIGGSLMIAIGIGITAWYGTLLFQLRCGIARFVADGSTRFTPPRVAAG